MSKIQRAIILDLLRHLLLMESHCRSTKYLAAQAIGLYKFRHFLHCHRGLFTRSQKRAIFSIILYLNGSAGHDTAALHGISGLNR